MDVAALEAEAMPLMASEAAYHYVAGGSDDEVTLAENREAWRRRKFLPHVLRDVSRVSTASTLLGAVLEVPILVAPMAAQKLAHRDGERGMARAAADAGTVMVVSTMATTSLEDVAMASAAPKWFQFYVHRDRALSADLVRRAEAAGYEAIVLTVDVPVLSRRRREETHRFELPDGMVVENIQVSLQSSGGSGLGEYTDAAFDPAITFEDIAWIESLGDLPVIVKGVLRPDDAVAAVEAGARGVIVSNHGGRQLDGAIVTADALPAVVDVVAGRVPVLVDGGISGGYDVAKALCLGADAVLVGRPMFWGLAVGGESGARGVLDEYASELRRAMALLGVTDLRQLDRSLLA